MSGGRCVHGLCRACCRVKCYNEGLDCPGHRILVKTKREKAAIYYAQQEKLKQEEQQGKEGEEGQVKEQSEVDKVQPELEVSKEEVTPVQAATYPQTLKHSVKTNGEEDEKNKANDDEGNIIEENSNGCSSFYMGHRRRYRAQRKWKQQKENERTRTRTEITSISHVWSSGGEKCSGKRVLVENWAEFRGVPEEISQLSTSLSCRDDDAIELRLER
ncbi:tRNA-dihydrouridine(16/17) synthase [NAD(P)(+)]-like [Homarus americanus]|uniref:tRNA-dihydrouridine(16/17) synthase [NAD(P)(+)]-like n=1 Tax=Homarus americanus TaxID=6706 RepID=A0A8J5JZQ2_HOMAM|nr:tRNA-dihydrouridine(16/17) synthase [NAD(P)(+)]-like [Homarus americanus]